MQAVVVTDPYLVSEVLSKETEIEKSIEGVYSKFNVVSPQAHMSAADLPIRILTNALELMKPAWW